MKSNFCFCQSFASLPKSEIVNTQVSSSSSSSSMAIESSNQPNAFKDLTDAKMFCMIELPIDENGNFPFPAEEFKANLMSSAEYDPENQFLTVELREGYGDSTCKYSRKEADRLQPEFIKISYHPDRTIKKFGETIRDYARQTHSAHIRWNVLEVCISLV